MMDKNIRFNVSVDSNGAVQVAGGEAQDGRGPGNHHSLPVILGEDYYYVYLDSTEKLSDRDRSLAMNEAIQYLLKTYG